MAARNHADDAAFASGSARGVTPPLLPTLMMAVLLGAGSYLCHEPSAVTPPAPVLATAVAAAPEAVVETPFIPAPLAFQTQFPMVVAAPAGAALMLQAQKAPARPARIAAPRRVEPPRVLARAAPSPEKTAPVPERTAPGGPLPFAAESDERTGSIAASDDGALPEIALPFAPTIRAVSRAGAAAGDFVGAQGAVLGAGTASLGTTVAGWVDRLR